MDRGLSFAARCTFRVVSRSIAPTRTLACILSKYSRYTDIYAAQARGWIINVNGIRVCNFIVLCFVRSFLSRWSPLSCFERIRVIFAHLHRGNSALPREQSRAALGVILHGEFENTALRFALKRRRCVVPSYREKLRVGSRSIICRLASSVLAVSTQPGFAGGTASFNSFCAVTIFYSSERPLKNYVKFTSRNILEYVTSSSTNPRKRCPSASRRHLRSWYSRPLNTKSFTELSLLSKA